MACAVWKAKEVDYFQMKYMRNCKGGGGAINALPT